MLEYEIVPNKGHYDVYIDGDFYCTADSYYEAASEIDDYKKDSNWFQNVKWDKACIECQSETNGVCRNIKCAKMHYNEQGKPIPADSCTID